VASLLCAIFKEGACFKDGGGSLFDHVNPFPANPNKRRLAFFLGRDHHRCHMWGVWAMVFRRFAVADDEHALMKRTTRWLLRGSILELLVAVPATSSSAAATTAARPIGTFWASPPAFP